VTEQAPTIGKHIRTTEPDQLAHVAERFVKEHFKALRVELLLADYRVAGLRPALREAYEIAGALRDQSAAARVFASQRPLYEELEGGGARALVPVTAWSDRIGVLAVDLSTIPDAAALDSLAAVGDELAVAVAAADRSTDRYRRTRRTQRLTMAAEMQWDLLPGRALGGRNFLLAGQLEPAYAVCGDHFDWALNERILTISVLNGDGNGIGASMLTVLAVNAMRNARRSGGSLMEQAELASDAIYSQHGGKHSVATLLLQVDTETGEIAAIDAGSPVALRLSGNVVSLIDLEKQMPLGMFADTRYDVQHFSLDPEDRLVIVSDGVHLATPGGRPTYGTSALAAALRETRLQPATEAVTSLMRSFDDYHQGADLLDDAVIVCLDWTATHRPEGSPR
jgi:serine phosphatase RsbU (regulator of sigma subunit)